MTDDFASAELSNGDRIVVDASVSTDGVQQVAVQLHRAAGTDSVLLPYPDAGLGGGRIIVSPSERLAVLSIHSGQSEEGYELFRIADGIKRVGGVGYKFGEFASYGFSPDETALAMALPFTCSEWWLPWDDDETEPDGPGRLSFGFGQLRLHDIATGKIAVHELRVSAPEDWDPERVDCDPDLEPQFLSSGAIQLSMPWGTVEISVPAPGVVVMRVDD